MECTIKICIYLEVLEVQVRSSIVTSIIIHHHRQFRPRL